MYSDEYPTIRSFKIVAVGFITTVASTSFAVLTMVYIMTTLEHYQSEHNKYFWFSFAILGFFVLLYGSALYIEKFCNWIAKNGRDT